MHLAGNALAWRPITPPDAPAWADLLAAAESADDTGEHYDTDDLLEELADSALDAQHDTVAVFAGEQMVAYGMARSHGLVHGVQRIDVEGCVDPGYRRQGIGRGILDRTLERAAALHRRQYPSAPGEVHTYCHDANTGAAALLSSFGMRPVRWWFDMQRPLAEPPPAAPVPDGLRLVGFDPAHDDAVREAHNEAFADHWGSTERDQSTWRQWFTGSRAFRPALSLVLMEGDDVAAYLLSYGGIGEQARGVNEVWIGQIGTRRRWRACGCASALLAEVLRRCAAAGFERVGLRVDAANPTGALGLYRRNGFTVRHRGATYVRPL